MIIPFDAPFLPDDPSERLDSKGRRDCSDLIEVIKNDLGVIVDYEVYF